MSKCCVVVKIPASESEKARTVIKVAKQYRGVRAPTTGMTPEWYLLDIVLPSRELALAFVQAAKDQQFAAMLEFEGDKRVGSLEAFLEGGEQESYFVPVEG